MGKIPQSIPWGTYMALHSLRTLPRKARLKHLTEENRTFYKNYRELKKELGRVPTWSELKQYTGLTSPPSINNHLTRLKICGLIADPENEYPDDLMWKDGFGRMLDLLDLWCQKYPEDSLVERTKRVGELMGLQPPRVGAEEAPEWLHALYRELNPNREDEGKKHLKNYRGSDQKGSK